MADDLEHLGIAHGLYEWVETTTEDWREHFEANYASKMEEYYRLWRGQWAESDKMRQSERSKIIAPFSGLVTGRQAHPYEWVSLVGSTIDGERRMG